MNHSCNTHEKFFLLIYLFCCFLFFRSKTLPEGYCHADCCIQSWTIRFKINIFFIYCRTLVDTNFYHVTTNFFITVFDIFWFYFFLCSILSYTSFFFVWNTKPFIPTGFPNIVLHWWCDTHARSFFWQSEFFFLLYWCTLYFRN